MTEPKAFTHAFEGGDDYVSAYDKVLEKSKAAGFTADETKMSVHYHGNNLFVAVGTVVPLPERLSGKQEKQQGSRPTDGANHEGEGQGMEDLGERKGYQGGVEPEG